MANGEAAVAVQIVTRHILCHEKPHSNAVPQASTQTCPSLDPCWRAAKDEEQEGNEVGGRVRGTRSGNEVDGTRSTVRGRRFEVDDDDDDDDERGPAFLYDSVFAGRSLAWCEV